MSRTYTVRRFVLMLPMELWATLDRVIGKQEEIHTTAEEFLDSIGLPAGKSAFYTDEERMFFDEIYDIHRRRP